MIVAISPLLDESREISALPQRIAPSGVMHTTIHKLTHKNACGSVHIELMRVCEMCNDPVANYIGFIASTCKRSNYGQTQFSYLTGRLHENPNKFAIKMTKLGISLHRIS